MKTLDAWLAEYGESHRNSTNRRVHKVCVPAILWSLTGLLTLLRFSSGGILRSAAGVGALLALGFYATLGLRPLIEMALMLALCFALCAATEFFTSYAGAIYGGVFALAWVGQLLGHAKEGAKPSFLKDLQFLLIGPLWVLRKH